MQYGNDFFVLQLFYWPLRLNRTMQYGNYFAVFSYSLHGWFKSYYVVWKLSSSHFNSFLVAQFKSYYVVWKLLYVSTNIRPRSVFKSYYVVWKLFFRSRQSAEGRGLNRTMQYGNCRSTKRITPHRIWFKSYYVVWKLAYVGFIVIIHPLFKSYYVVWKRLLDEVFKMCFPCLNRTMQYGNQYVCAGEKYISVGLNRTMQYGNFS